MNEYRLECDVAQRVFVFVLVGELLDGFDGLFLLFAVFAFGFLQCVGNSFAYVFLFVVHCLNF